MMNLQSIFNKQRELIESLAPVERSLGYTPPQIPLDFTTRAGQDWFRLMSWYLVEEITESIADPTNPEELADCIHFAVELCILAGTTPDQVESSLFLDQFDPLPASDLIQVITSIGNANNLLKAKHWRKNPIPTPIPEFQFHVASALYHLLRTIRNQGLDPHEIFFKKMEINHARIQSNY